MIGEREVRERVVATRAVGVNLKRQREDADESGLEGRGISRDSTPSSSSTTMTVVAPEDEAKVSHDLAYPPASPTYIPLVLDCDPQAPPSHRPRAAPSASASASPFPFPQPQRSKSLSPATTHTQPQPPPERSKSAGPVLCPTTHAHAHPKDTTAFDVTVIHNPTGGGRRIRPEHVSKRRRTDTAAPWAPSPPPPDRAPIQLVHVDLMYIPLNGRLVCRACLYVFSLLFLLLRWILS